LHPESQGRTPSEKPNCTWWIWLGEGVEKKVDKMTGGENRGRGEEKKPREEEEGIVVPWLQFLITCSMQSNIRP